MKLNTDQKRFRVTFLLDKSNSWIEPFIHRSGILDNNSRYHFSVSYNPDQIIDQQIVFIIGYTKILSPSFLTRNHLNLVIHESKLPKGKGYSPVQWQILDGERFIGVSLIEAVERVDAGDILLQNQLELDGYELLDEIRFKQARVTLNLIREFLMNYPKYDRRPQTGTETFYRRRTVNDGELDPDKTIRDQFNLLRIGNNDDWPSYFCLDGRKYILKIFKGE